MAYYQIRSIKLDCQKKIRKKIFRSINIWQIQSDSIRDSTLGRWFTCQVNEEKKSQIYWEKVEDLRQKRRKLWQKMRDLWQKNENMRQKMEDLRQKSRKFATKTQRLPTKKSQLYDKEVEDLLRKEWKINHKINWWLTWVNVCDHHKWPPQPLSAPICECKFRMIKNYDFQEIESGGKKMLLETSNLHRNQIKIT